MSYDFSVLICSKNGGFKLERMLESLFKQDTVIREIILIDDGSEIPIRAKTERIKLIRHAQSLGLISCRNKLASLASGQFLVFLDDDVILDDKDLFQKAMEILMADPEIGALGINQRGMDGTWLDLQPAKKMTGTAQVYFGWAHIIKRSAWKVVGPFREAFDYGWEESDFSLRLWNKGYKVVSSEFLSVIHDGASPGKKKAHRHFLNLRNSILSILLNFPAPLLPSWLKGTLLKLNPLPDSAEPPILFRIRIIFSILFLLPYLIKNRNPVSMRAVELFFYKKSD